MRKKSKLTENDLVGLIKKILVEQLIPTSSGSQLEYTPPKTGVLAKLLKPYPLDLFDKQGKLVRKITLTNFTYGDGSNVAFDYQVKRKDGSMKKGTIEVFCSGENTILDRKHSMRYFYNDNFIKQLPEYCRGVNSTRI